MMPRRSKSFLRYCTLVLAFIALACFDDDLAGGYDDVENPAFTVALRNPKGEPALAARVQLFAHWQNPLLDSLPLVDVEATQGQATIRDSQMVLAMRALHQRGTPWPSADTVAFNLVGRLDNQETFEAGYLLLRNSQGKYQFYRQQTGGLLSGEKNVLTTHSTLENSIFNLQGDIGGVGKDLGLQAVFIAGSPYQAKVDSQGRFRIARLAKGRYELKAQASDGKVYTAPNTLDTDATGIFQAEDWVESDVIWIAP